MIFRSMDWAASESEASFVSERAILSLSLARLLFTAVCGLPYELFSSLSSLPDPHAAKKVTNHRRKANKGKKRNWLRKFIFRWYYMMIRQASLAMKRHSRENLASFVAVSLAHAVLVITRAENWKNREAMSKSYGLGEC